MENCYYDKPNSIDCALVCVDEIIEATKIVYDRPDFQGTVYSKYWQEVKQEILNL